MLAVARSMKSVPPVELDRRAFIARAGRTAALALASSLLAGGAAEPVPVPAPHAKYHIAPLENGSSPAAMAAR